MNAKKILNYSDKEKQQDIFKLSQLSVQQLHQELSNNPSLINSVDNNGETLLSYALKNNNNKIYDLLLNSSFLFLNFQDLDGNSYLHLAVKKQNEKIIKNLIEKGINLNLQNKKGNTALHTAHEIGNISIIKSLLEHGINKRIKNQEGKKAEEIQKINNLKKIQSVDNYNDLNKKNDNNKSIRDIKSSKQVDKKTTFNINNQLIQENGGKYQDHNIKTNIYSKTNSNKPKYIIQKNILEKIQTENFDKNNSTMSKEKDKKNNNKKGSLYKIFSIKDNNIKDKKEEKTMDNKDDIHLAYTDRSHHIYDITKKIKHLEESSSSFLDSSDSRKKSKNGKIVSSNKGNSINEYEYIKENKSNNKKRKNNKRANYRNNFYNLSDLNNIEKWNTIALQNSPKKLKEKNKEESNIKHKGSITKRNSPKKNASYYSNKKVNKASNTSRSKNKKYKESFAIKTNNKGNQIERYDNDEDNALNIEDEIIKKLEQKEYIFEEEDINNNKNLIFEEENNIIKFEEENNIIKFEEDNTNQHTKKNSIISFSKMNKIDESILNMKSGKLLRDFLSQINMDKYLLILANNGFDDINLILDQSKNGGISIQDCELKEAGISVPGDRAKILIRIQELSNNFPFPVPKDVYHRIEDINKIENDEPIQKLKKWLENLKVEDYLINFIYSGYHSIELLFMQMVSYNPLTNEMLKEEIGIDKIGYRSRIINKLKDESRNFLGQLKTKILIINKGENNSNNCQCRAF